MKRAEILDETMRCTIDDDADLDNPENFYFKYNDVLEAMQEYGKYCAERAWKAKGSMTVYHGDFED